MGHSRKKNKNKRVGHEFLSRVIEETKCGLYKHTLHQKRSGVFRGVQDRAASGGISMGLGFWPWNFRGCHKTLQNFQGAISLFSPEFLCGQRSHDTMHDSMIHGPLKCFMMYYITTLSLIKYVYIYLILFLFNSFYIILFILFPCLSGWDKYDTVWYIYIYIYIYIIHTYILYI